MKSLKDIGCNFLDVIDNPTQTYFIQNYEDKGIPVLIKNVPLNWKAFNWTDKHVAETIGYPDYDEYLERETPYILDNDNILNKDFEGYMMTPEGDGVTYLSNVPLFQSDLQNDYTIPELFADAAYQPEEWQWLFWGPATAGTSLHTDIDHSEAWNVIIYGHKLWTYFYDGKPHHAIQGPGDIIYTPVDVPHHCVNLSKCLAITHNYKRSPGHSFFQRGANLITKIFNKEVPGTINHEEED